MWLKSVEFCCERCWGTGCSILSEKVGEMMCTLTPWGLDNLGGNSAEASNEDGGGEDSSSTRGEYIASAMCMDLPC